MQYRYENVINKIVRMRSFSEPTPTQDAFRHTDSDDLVKVKFKIVKVKRLAAKRAAITHMVEIDIRQFIDV